MKRKKHIVNICSVLLLLIISSTGKVYSQSRFFKSLSFTEKTAKLKTVQIKNITDFSLLEIDEASLKIYLSNSKGISLEIPMPNGQTETFNVWEASVLSPEQEAIHPEIRTYKGQGKDHPGYKIRMSLTPTGFSGIITGMEGGMVMVERIKNIPGNNLYKSYFSKNAIFPENMHSGSRCKTTSQNLPELKKMANAKFTNGTNIRTFRIAIAATGEYTTAKGGQSNAFSEIVQYVNELNAIYEAELGVNFTLVSGTNVVYTNSSTDPYTANDQGVMLSQNQTALNTVIGTANYDIGHVFGDGGAGSGGGLASFQSLCNTNRKGQGASDIGNEQNYAHVFSVQLVAHEIGHQFGMSHSYNSNIPVCTTREYSMSVEPGSGATIMSYGFTCSNNNPGNGNVGDDDYHHNWNGGVLVGPFLNFHVKSIQQSLDFLATVSCGTTASSSNAMPVLSNTQSAFTIPKSTPFYLKGTATDANINNVLSYSWEGTNISDLQDVPDPNDPNSTIPPPSLDASVLSNTTHPPFFRSYPPISVGTEPGLRYYPLLSAILNGTNQAKGDKLPSVPIVTTHTLTVRDGNGGITTKDVTVTIDNSGPFLITNDPTGTHFGGSSMNVTWSVNGTNNAPVNCKLVDIWLSTDGGYTFTSLANAVTNNGTANITLPNVSTTQARIKITPSLSTASGNVPNVFFDISNIDFAINGTTLGTQEVNNSDIKIYTDSTMIIIRSDIQLIQSVELYDASARNIYYRSKINSHRIEIPSNGYGKQILIVKVITNQGKMITKKVSIN
ncbi:M12 family metallo-peptidase [Chryseobacterium daecheongense]|uniref:reprolysin-like metallopeptidase n=1 Tax=Chryseobacterium daecheongense TaxID=192389 RepID=UPI001FD68F7F|nr:zinc-dependent metalloprotease family protein [Chryseobacterium daecheongense]UOU99903.1 M12 family metallo-peptidase [Chryseobacterium daecheongense]